MAHPVQLLETVRVYLAHRGQWEAAGRELGVHRNSVRYRIAQAKELLGVDLDDPDVTAQLWLALRSRP
nr:helix-turn-helix domain-containing protein [Arthrobacter sp. 260]